MRLLILEDDPAWRAEMATIVTGAGHAVQLCGTVAELKLAVRRESFDLVLLDWNLPDATGYDVMIWARESLITLPPVIMVTSRTDPEDIVSALDAGADDYVIKPCDRKVLLARIGAVLRRTYPEPQLDAQQRETLAGATFNHATHSVDISGEHVGLTAREFELALHLFRNLERPMGRAHLLELVWGFNAEAQTRTVDVHVSKIRNRLRLRPEFGYRLLPVYNFGYRLEKLDESGAA